MAGTHTPRQSSGDGPRQQIRSLSTSRIGSSTPSARVSSAFTLSQRRNDISGKMEELNTSKQTVQSATEIPIIRGGIAWAAVACGLMPVQNLSRCSCATNTPARTHVPIKHFRQVGSVACHSSSHALPAAAAKAAQFGASVGAALALHLVALPVIAHAADTARYMRVLHSPVTFPAHSPQPAVRALSPCRGRQLSDTRGRVQQQVCIPPPHTPSLALPAACAAAGSAGSTAWLYRSIVKPLLSLTGSTACRMSSCLPFSSSCWRCAALPPATCCRRSCQSSRNHDLPW